MTTRILASLSDRPTSRPCGGGDRTAPRRGPWSPQSLRAVARSDTYSLFCHYSLVKEPDTFQHGTRKRERGDCRVPTSPFRVWWSRWDSNPRPPGCKPGALPTELRPQPISDGGCRMSDEPDSDIPYPRSGIALVGPGGFEPPTSPLSGARSSRLSYEPTDRVDFRFWLFEPASKGPDRHVTGTVPSKIGNQKPQIPDEVGSSSSPGRAGVC